MIFSRPLPRLRPLLLPVEHGGWGFLFEPIVIALIAVPSAAGLSLCLAAIAAFLARQPLKIAIDDWRHGRRVPRTGAARAIAAGYLLVAALAIAVAARGGNRPFWPLAMGVAPLAIVTLWYDGRGESRRLVPELSGATALAAVAAAAALAVGWQWPLALALWASALVRVLPAIVTVRERVMRLHRQVPSMRGPAAAHAVAVLATAALVSSRLAPGSIALIAVLLAARAAWDLRVDAPQESAMRIGIRELVMGLLAAVAIGATWTITR